MFESLKKKFSSWLAKEEEKPKKTKKEKEKKAKPAKAKKQVRQKHVKKEKSIEEITQERETTEKVMQDIKQEGIDTTSPDVKVQAAIEEIKQEEAETKIEEENIELEQKEEQEKGEKKKSWWSFGKKKKGEKEEQIIITDIEKKENFFTKLANKLSTSKLKEEDFDDAFQDLEITLLENNTALEAVDKIRESLRASLVNKEIKKNKIQETIVQSLKDAILSVLIEPPNLIEQIKEKNKNNEPYVILFFGINGSGKTTSIAKLAHKLKKDGISSVLAAGDTFRAASIEQLKTHAEKINVPIIMHDYGGDPASVAFDTIKYAKQHKVDVVLIDTAGRMYTKTNLLKEMEKIVRVSKPDLKIFVGESITGNDVISQSQTFNDAIGIDGSILTKSDIDEKGGAILSVSYVTKKPIYYLGIGQGYDDLEIFNPRKVLEKLGL